MVIRGTMSSMDMPSARSLAALVTRSKTGPRQFLALVSEVSRSGRKPSAIAFLATSKLRLLLPWALSKSTPRARASSTSGMTFPSSRMPCGLPV